MEFTVYRGGSNMLAFYRGYEVKNCEYAFIPKEMRVIIRFHIEKKHIGEKKFTL